MCMTRATSREAGDHCNASLVQLSSFSLNTDAVLQAIDACGAIPSEVKCSGACLRAQETSQCRSVRETSGQAAAIRYVAPAFAIVLISMLSVLIGCASSATAPPPGPPASSPTNPSPGGSTQPSIQITGSSQVRLGSSAQYTANVTGESSPSVVWTAHIGETPIGQITPSGLYTPPSSLPGSSTLTVTATSAVDPTVTASIPVQLLNPTPQLVSAAISAVPGTSTYMVSLGGSGFVASSTVLVNSVAAAIVDVSSTALHALVQASTLSARTAIIQVSNPGSGGAPSQPLQIPVTPAIAIAGPAQVRLDSSAQYTATLVGEASTGVVWSAVAGQAASGSISSTGVYTPPSSLPNPDTLTITATSSADPAISQSFTVQLLNPAPQLVSGELSVQPGTSAYTISLEGSGFLNSSIVYVNSVPAKTSSVSPTTVVATISASLLAGASSKVYVSNPEPGAATSQTIQVPVPPQTTSITAAARLLDQVTFGPTSGDITHVQSVGLRQYLQEQIATKPTPVTFENWWFGALQPGCSPFYQCEVDASWAQNALFAPDQLRQRVAFALSKIFVTSYFSVPAPMFPYFLNVLTTDSVGNWRTLMQDVTQSEAMGTYLNMFNSPAPGPGQHADENYARELMQLFSIGPNRLNEDGTLQSDANGMPIPNYTADIVQAFARAYTGWTYANDNCSAPQTFQNIVNGYMPGLTCPMAAIDSLHDKTQKTLLRGASLPAGQSALQDLNAALDNIFEDPSLPPFVVKQLIQNLVSSSPSPAYIERVVQVFKDDGQGVRGDMAAVLVAILMDPEARQGDVGGAPLPGAGHMRDPILWNFAVLRALSATQVGDNSGLSYAAGLAGYAGEQAHSESSVFSFYSPSFVIPGTTLNAPEFQLETPANVSNLSLDLEGHILSNSFIATSTGAAVNVDLGSSSYLGSLAAQGVEPLIAGLNTLFCHGQMSSEAHQVLSQNLTNLNTHDMLQVGLYAILLSPQFRIIQ